MFLQYPKAEFLMLLHAVLVTSQFYCLHFFEATIKFIFALKLEGLGHYFVVFVVVTITIIYAKKNLKKIVRALFNLKTKDIKLTIIKLCLFLITLKKRVSIIVRQSGGDLSLYFKNSYHSQL